MYVQEKTDATLWLFAGTVYHQTKNNGQKKTDKRSNNDIQNTTQKNKDRATRIQLKTGG